MVLASNIQEEFHAWLAQEVSEEEQAWILLELSWIDAYLYRRSRQQCLTKRKRLHGKSLSVYSHPAVSENTSPIP